MIATLSSEDFARRVRRGVTKARLWRENHRDRRLFVETCFKVANVAGKIHFYYCSISFSSSSSAYHCRLLNLGPVDWSFFHDNNILFSQDYNKTYNKHPNTHQATLSLRGRRGRSIEESKLQLRYSNSNTSINRGLQIRVELTHWIDVH